MNYIPIEQMQDKWLVGVVGISSRVFASFQLTLFQCNLKPANMRGVKSFAMVLCVGKHPAAPADKASVELRRVISGDLQRWKRGRYRNSTASAELQAG